MCKQESERRYKGGWGVLARIDWFVGRCEGRPLGMIFPSVIDAPDPEEVADANPAYADWLSRRLRAVWPPERAASP